MDEQWGPWIEHTPGPRPYPPGTYMHLVFGDGREFIGPIGMGIGGFGIGENGWWHKLGFNPIIRYRVRQFSAMERLKRIAELPEMIEA